MKTLPISFLASLLLIPGLTMADEPVVLFADDFSAPEENGLPDQDLWGANSYQQRGNEANQWVRVTNENSGQYFGEADNNYLHFYSDGTDSSSVWLTANNRLVTASPVVSVHFDFYNSDSSAVGPTARVGRNDPIASNAQRTQWQLRFENNALSPVLGLIRNNTTHRLQWVYNNSDQPVIYHNGEVTVMPDSYDVWIDGILVLASEKYGAAPSPIPLNHALTSFGIGIFGIGQNELRIDNLVIYEGAHVENTRALPDLLFADDFSDPEPDNTPSLAIWRQGPANVSPGTREIEVTSVNAEEFFGEAGNNYLRFYHVGWDSGNLHMTTPGGLADPSQVITIAFDFYESPDFGEGDFSVHYGRGTIGASNRSHHVAFNKGTVSGEPELYEPGQPNSVRIIANNSFGPVSYLGGAHTVASDAFDVWINGEKVLSNHTHTRGTIPVGAPLNSLQFVIWTTDSNEFLIDNLAVYSFPFVDGDPGPGGQTFAEWALSLPEGQRGPGDNPAGDGIPNAVKFVLGLDGNAPGRAGLPVLEPITDGGEEYLSLVFQRSTSTEGAALRFEATADLAVWEAIIPVLEVLEELGEGRQLVRARDPMPKSATDRRFLRLVVEID